MYLKKLLRISFLFTMLTIASNTYAGSGIWGGEDASTNTSTNSLSNSSFGTNSSSSNNSKINTSSNRFGSSPISSGSNFKTGYSSSTKNTSKFNRSINKVKSWILLHVFGIKKRNSGGNTINGSFPSVPIDGGLGLLLLGAAAFGINKLRRNNETAL